MLYMLCALPRLLRAVGSNHPPTAGDGGRAGWAAAPEGTAGAGPAAAAAGTGGGRTAGVAAAAAGGAAAAGTLVVGCPGVAGGAAGADAGAVAGTPIPGGLYLPPLPRKGGR